MSGIRFRFLKILQPHAHGILFGFINMSNRNAAPIRFSLPPAFPLPIPLLSLIGFQLYVYLAPDNQGHVVAEWTRTTVAGWFGSNFVGGSVIFMIGMVRYYLCISPCWSAELSRFMIEQAYR